MSVQNQIQSLCERGYSIRAIAKALKMSRKTVRKFMDKPKQDPSLVAVEVIDSTKSGCLEIDKTHEVEPSNSNEAQAILLPKWLSLSDFEWVVAERKKGITFKTLHDELKPSVTYWTFWNAVKQLLAPTPEISVRLSHKPGEKVQVDFTDGLTYWDSAKNLMVKSQLFVGVLPFSQKTYAVFVASQKKTEFIRAHESMWEYFGGVARYTVPDNLKTAVSKACLYDPDLNKTFCDYANHAGFAVLPARPLKPRDKGAVECGCKLFQRSFYESVRNKKYYSLWELNSDLSKYLKEFNSAIMKDYGVSRNERFQAEVKTLGSLPDSVFDIAAWSTAKVHPDCHIQVDHCLYSVPWQYVGKHVRVCLRDKSIIVYDQDKLQSIASHVRGKYKGDRKTEPQHYPPEKMNLIQFDFERALHQARQIGPEMGRLVEYLSKEKHPLQYLRPIQGMLRLRLKDQFLFEHLEYAAKMCLAHKRFRLKFFKDCCARYKHLGPTLEVIDTAPQRKTETLHLHQESLLETQNEQ